ncbi:MAG: hypothetical protein O4861_04330 [Trichodesmium sp. St16_bin4-tuft]|nr:hypothetical protein [Trichodesmium sp. St4_bin8_1]MDE5072270.1 hypothetical protein [Trichodesmium sp. St5_bin8]MDE5078145.1 hypothetical protein [Trichodesmium sp. St2_bin6]MDE5091044.1 hypothetical protein [Trichodesmium sp. St18_bin3_1_1]MDE5097601.1 hypothetical protein [Trichodesmium sp. St16_bin4-tuft]
MPIAHELIGDGLKGKSLTNTPTNPPPNYSIYHYYLGLLIFLYREIGITLRFSGVRRWSFIIPLRVEILTV